MLRLMEWLIFLFVVVAVVVIGVHAFKIARDNKWRREAPVPSAAEVIVPGGFKDAEMAWARILPALTSSGQQVSWFFTSECLDANQAPELRGFIAAPTEAHLRATSEKIKVAIPGVQIRNTADDCPITRITNEYVLQEAASNGTQPTGLIPVAGPSGQ